MAHVNKQLHQAIKYIILYFIAQYQSQIYVVFKPNVDSRVYHKTLKLKAKNV